SENMTNSSSPPKPDASPAAVAMSRGQIHELLWALAESHFRKAQALYKSSLTAQTENSANIHWQASIVAGLTCLYSVVKICEAPRSQAHYFGSNPVTGPDTEAKTRLRIASVLAEWCNDSQTRTADEQQGEEERQLTRALMAVPNADSYLPTRYAIIAAHCRLFVRRGEYKWAEQKLKSAYMDAQKRQQLKWAYHFVFEISKLYLACGNTRGSANVLQHSAAMARKSGDTAGEVVVSAELLGQLMQMRNWTAVDALTGRIDTLMTDQALAEISPVRTRYWALKAAAAIMVGNVAGAQAACDFAREALKEWQHVFARQLVQEYASHGGSIVAIANPHIPSISGGFMVRGGSYYELHAWVMLVSALSVSGDNKYEQFMEFLQRAFDGIVRGEADGFKRQLQQLKLHVLLHAVDAGLAALRVSEAKSTLDEVMAVVADSENHPSIGNPDESKLRRQKTVWRSNRDAITLRWAMYMHRTGEFEAAMQAYRCVVKNGASDLRYAAQINIAVMHLSAPMLTQESEMHVRQILHELSETTPNTSKEMVRAALLDFVQGIESKEPVKAKTHLLACMRTCNEIADAALQGWTLCLLGTLMLPTGQYGQTLKMCAAGQAIAQRANDLLQNAAAVGLLTHIERAVGDSERCTKLLEVDQRLLEEFNALIQHAA
ncbi:hypothetical protein GGI25_002991, partial [Coemansia spiralis]